MQELDQLAGFTESGLHAIRRDRPSVRFGIKAKGWPGGFVVEVRFEQKLMVLKNTRGKLRIFPNLTKLAVLLRKIGFATFRVDSTGYAPALVRSPRPDRARIRDRR